MSAIEEQEVEGQEELEYFADDLEVTLRKLVKEIEEERQCRIVLLSLDGSRARGNFRKDSDVDLRGFYVRNRIGSYVADSLRRGARRYEIRKTLKDDDGLKFDVVLWDVCKVIGLSHEQMVNQDPLNWMRADVKLIHDMEICHLIRVLYEQRNNLASLERHLRGKLSSFTIGLSLLKGDKFVKYATNAIILTLQLLWLYDKKSVHVPLTIEKLRQETSDHSLWQTFDEIVAAKDKLDSRGISREIAAFRTDRYKFSKTEISNHEALVREDEQLLLQLVTAIQNDTTTHHA